MFNRPSALATGGDVLVLFQPHNPDVPPKWLKNVAGTDLDIKNDYYPWLRDVLKKDYVKRVNLVGEVVPYPTYFAPQARNINFEAVLHANDVVTSKEPQFKETGVHPAFIYPDGTSDSDDSDAPNFRKLEAIRLKTEANP
jgi:hypothetical protein